MSAWLRRAWCAVTEGHLPVTRSGGGRVEQRCYLCDARLSPGWDFRAPVKRAPTTRQPVRLVRGKKTA